MEAIVECVPNFSEGRDRTKIAAIVAAIEQTHGVWVLHVDSGASVNRTVVTFAGQPNAVVDAAFAGIREAARQIDMRRQTGAHPRQGSTDVCPFVPLANASMEDCVGLAQRLGRRVARELEIPVFLYGRAAIRPDRVDLAALRRGGFEALGTRMSSLEGHPDFGAPVPHPSAGALVTGARGLLVAYNVNLNRPDPTLARRIARALREDPAGVAGRSSAVGLPACRALGWLIPEFDRAQVTLNLINHRITGLHQAYEAVGQLARSWGAGVTGSEVVGLVPESALLAAGTYYCAHADGHAGMDRLRSRQAQSRQAIVDHSIAAAIQGLGLDDVRPFDPETQILERVMLRASGCTLGGVSARP